MASELTAVKLCTLGPCAVISLANEIRARRSWAWATLTVNHVEVGIRCGESVIRGGPEDDRMEMMIAPFAATLVELRARARVLIA